jgi:putative transposase
MLYVRIPLWWRNVEDVLVERGIDLGHETVRLWWNRLGPLLPGRSAASGSAICAAFAIGSAARQDVREAGRRDGVPVARCRSRERDLESYITKTRDKEAALRCLKNATDHPRRSSPTASNHTLQRCVISAIRRNRGSADIPTTERRAAICRSEDESGQC